jgi:hypothetical protein
MKRLALTIAVITLTTAACAKHQRPKESAFHPNPPSTSDSKPTPESQATVTPSQGPTDPTGPTDGAGDTKPPVDSWTSLNMSSPDGNPLSRDELYAGTASYSCDSSDRLIIQKVNNTVTTNLKIVKLAVGHNNNKPSQEDLTSAANTVGDSIFLCNQLRSTIDLKSCSNPAMLLDVSNVGSTCDRLKDIKGSVTAAKSVTK